MRPEKKQERKERKGERELGERREKAGWGGEAVSQDSALGCRQGHSLSTHLYKMLCRTEAKGVMPTPAPMSTACSGAKILRLGVL